MAEPFASRFRQAVDVRRIGVLAAAVLILVFTGMVQSSGSPMGPSAAAAHAPCYSEPSPGSNCMFVGHYEKRENCRRQGRRSLAAPPWPRLDWEHYHCVETRRPGLWALFLYDLGEPG